MSATILGRVLVVDDELQLMDALVESLTAHGYEAHGFNIGVAAIEALQLQEYDLLLTDLMMPGMDGITLLKACMAIDPNLVGIIMTGQGTVSTAVDAMRSGAFDYVLKPFRLDAVLPVLARARAMQQLRLENIQLRETVAIYNLSQTIALSLDGNIVLENTVEAALQQTGADEVSIMLLKPDSNQLYIAAVRGRGREHLLGQHISLQDGIASWVARHFEPLILNGEVTDPRFTPVQPRPEIRSAVSIPMMAAGKLVGVLNVNHLQARRPFTVGQVKALSILTSTAAAALENEAVYSALDAREKRFRSLIENAPDGIALLGIDGKLRQVTPSTEHILGYTLNDSISQDPALLTHPDDLPNLLFILNDLIQNPEKVARAEYRFMHKDGSWRWLESTVSNLLAEPGVQAIVFNYRDITERQQAEAAVRESEDRLSQVWEATSDAMALSDLEGIVLAVNPAYLELYGYPLEQVIGRSFAIIFPADEQEAALEQYKSIFAREAIPPIFESAIGRSDGEIRIVETSVTFLTESGRRTAMLSTIRDMTQRKQAELALQQAKDFAENVIQTANVIFLQLDTEGNVAKLNAAAEEISGYSQAELEGRSWFETVVPRERYPRVWDEFIRISERGETTQIFENPMLTKQGEERHILWKNSVLRIGQNIVGTISFGVDITERKRAEESLQRSQERFSKAFMASPAGLVISRVDDGKFVDANQTYLRMVEYQREEVIGHTSTELNLTSLAERTRLIKTLREEGRLLNFEMQLRTKSGRLVNMLFSSQQIELDGVDHLLSTTIDITDTKRAEEQIRYQAHLLSNVNDAIFASDENYRVTYWNQAAESLYGWKADEVIGKVAPDLTQTEFPGADPDEMRRHIRETGFWRGEVTQLKKDGSRFPCEISTLLVHDEKDKVTGYVSINRDITARKQAEQQTRFQLERLKALRAIDVAISSSFDLRLTLDILLDYVVSQLKIDAAVILLFHPVIKTLEYAASRGFRSTAIRNSRVRLGEGYAGQAILERRIVHIPNLMEVSMRPGKNPMQDENFIAYYCAPLIVKGQVKGVLEICHRSARVDQADWLDFLETLAGQAAIAIENANLFEDLQHSNSELFQAYDATIEGWSHALDLRDKETEGHSLRVTEMTLKLSSKFGFTEEQMRHIRWGALLHDIGKMGIPDNILLKPDKLTDEEWERMKQHPVFALEMLSPIAYLKSALDIPYCHHEKWDGTGYPRGLKGDVIPLAARLFAIVDVWDALRSDRPYRKAWSVEKTVEHIRSFSGTHFDPQVVEHFLGMIQRAN